jgi:hypothetical protein
MSAICIVFIGVSFDSMMKSGTLIGVSIIARCVFGQHYHCYQWCAILVVVMALTLVGAAGIFGAEESETIRTSRFTTALILGLKFVSQVGYAVRLSYEEYFVQRRFYHPILICGVEGFWGFLFIGVIGQTVAHFLPGEEGNGLHEDFLDTVAQIHHQPSLWGVIVVAFALGLVYNCVSATLIGRTSAVVRTLVESLRTFLIWMVQFAVFYGCRASTKLFQYRFVGEEWTDASLVQAAGFLLMTWGLCMYNSIPRYPCFSYAPAAGAPNDEPSLVTPMLEETDPILAI